LAPTVTQPATANTDDGYDISGYDLSRYEADSPYEADEVDEPDDVDDVDDVVADAVADAGRATIAEALKAAAHPVAFACGVEVLPPLHFEIESASFQEQRLREMQRGLAEDE